MSACNLQVRAVYGLPAGGFVWDVIACAAASIHACYVSQLRAVPAVNGRGNTEWNETKRHQAKRHQVKRDHSEAKQQMTETLSAAVR